MTDEELYRGREQTLVKHFILRKYLERFAHIVGSFADSITYVDCFSGPWNVRSDDLADSSFSIALRELRKAQATWAEQGRSVKLRCMFLEAALEPFARLDTFAQGITDAEIETRNGELSGNVDEILKFVKQGGSKSFPFIFIDPTGWTGFGMQLIGPLLRLNPGEMLINFMTDFIRRFIDHPDEPTREQFADLFGSGEVKKRVQSLRDPLDREDALFRAYAENVQRAGHFAYTCSAYILYPDIDRTFFHLIYATRHRKGVEVFKNVEKQSVPVMEQARAAAKQNKQKKKASGQGELFGAQETYSSNRVELLRARHLEQARAETLASLRTGNAVPYDECWDLVMAYPLVWDSDLKEWISQWKREGLVIEGMKPRQRVPKLEEGIVLRWPQGGKFK